MNYLNCLECGIEVEAKAHNQKYCSRECAGIACEKRNYVPSKFKGNTATTTGAISELRTAIDLMSRGYHVFRALSPSCPCDLAVLQGDKLIKIEVRTVKMSYSGKVIKSKFPRDDTEMIDHYAWVTPTGVIYEPELEPH